MTVPPESRDVVRGYVAKAENDLEAARRILADERNCPFDAACFHCQQAAEKYLKALLTFLGVEAPRTHDLVVLHRLLPGCDRSALDENELSVLSSYAVAIRYAGPEPTRDEAADAFTQAQEVRRQVRALLPADISEEDSCY